MVFSKRTGSSESLKHKEEQKSLWVKDEYTIRKQIDEDTDESQEFTIKCTKYDPNLQIFKTAIERICEIGCTAPKYLDYNEDKEHFISSFDDSILEELIAKFEHLVSRSEPESYESLVNDKILTLNLSNYNSKNFFGSLKYQIPNLNEIIINSPNDYFQEVSSFLWDLFPEFVDSLTVDFSDNLQSHEAGIGFHHVWAFPDAKLNFKECFVKLQPRIFKKLCLKGF